MEATGFSPSDIAGTVSEVTLTDSNQPVEVSQKAAAIQITDIRVNGVPYIRDGIVQVQRTKRADVGTDLRIGETVRANVDSFYLSLREDTLRIDEEMTVKIVVYDEGEVRGDQVAIRQPRRDQGTSGQGVALQQKFILSAGASGLLFPFSNTDIGEDFPTVVLQTVNVENKGGDAGEVTVNAINIRLPRPPPTNDVTNVVADGLGVVLTTTGDVYSHNEIQADTSNFFPYALTNGQEIEFEVEESGGMQNVDVQFTLVGYVPR